MVNPLKIEHAKIHVQNLREAVNFYTNVMGLVELEQSDGTVYLGCGMDVNFDLAIREGGTGLEHIAFRVGSEDTFEGYLDYLDENDIEIVRTDGDEPGQMRGLRLTLPSGFSLELVVLEDPTYPHTDDVAYPARLDVAPLDFDHVNIRSPDVQADVEFLVKHLGFRVSEIIGTPDEWSRAFVRCNEQHHDIAMGPRSSDADHASLHHICFAYGDFDHMKRFVDRLTQADVELERAFGRHYAGDNLFSYFWSPCGNRIELTAEMATIYTEETVYLPQDIDAGTSWGAESPESFKKGSGLAGIGN